MEPGYARSIIDQHADTEVIVANHVFEVSSARMMRLSPKMHDIFGDSERRIIELPDDDPTAFGLVCELAHGLFVTSDRVSIDTLVNLAKAIERYGIPASSPVFETAKYSFYAETLKPAELPIGDLIRCVPVAEMLGLDKARMLIEDNFRHCSLHFADIVNEQAGGTCHDKVALMLGKFNTMRWPHLAYQSVPAMSATRSAECRVEIASLLLKARINNSVLCRQEIYDVPSWILGEQPSLRDIESRLRALRQSLHFQQSSIMDALSAIREASAELGSYLRKMLGNTAREFERAADEESIDQDGVPDVLSDCGTGFEDIEAYDDHNENFDCCVHSASDTEASV